MTTAPQTKKKGGHRRMKQMQGLLLLSRLDGQQSGKTRLNKPQHVTVVLQPQLLELAYSSLADQDMLKPLGRIDLREAKLEQVPDGFVIYEAGSGTRKFKLQDKDKATTDAWFFAVYTAITEYERLPISASEDVGHKFSAVLTSSLRDDHTETVEFELSCQLVLPARPIDKPSIKWKAWKTYSELQTFDDELRVSFGSHMKQIAFPRDRKRDSLFGGMRKKSLQDLKEQQLALYVEQVFQMPEISIDPVLVSKVKQFLGFDSFFEITPLSSDESDDNDSDSSEELPITIDPLPTPQVSKFAESPEANDVSEPPLSSESLDATHLPAEPVSYSSQAPSSQYSSTGSISTAPALLRRRSSPMLDDEGEEFVEATPETDPKAAKKLHKMIIQTVRELVSYDEERVQDFQDQTKDFGREKTSAMEYCAFLLGAIGAQECCKLIPEMAKLLPDDVKRNELLQARAAIWRRTHRRHRRRSKQFSESVVLQKQKEEQQQVEGAHSRMRPKSDSLGALNWGSESAQPLHIPVRNSMVERSMPAIDTDLHNHASDNGAAAIPAYQAGLADPRRHLNRRASFNSMFGETVPPGPIKEEENPAEKDSDVESDDSLLDRSRISSREMTSMERKQSQNGIAWARPSDFGRQNSSFIDEDDDDTEDDEENQRSRRSRRSRQQQQSGSGSASLDNRTVKERPLSRGDLTQARSSHHNSSFIGNDDGGYSGNEGEDSHTRFRRSQRRASRKFDEEAKSVTVPEEENPVLARLKKQGAVNFMMQLR